MSTSIIIFLVCLSTFVHGQISTTSGINWDEMPEHLKPKEVPSTKPTTNEKPSATDGQFNIDELDQEEEQFTPEEVRNLLEACSNGLIPKIQEILNEGADINAIEYRMGDTALHSATWGNHLNVIEFLLQNSADPNIKNLAGYTPLLLAVRKETPESLDIIKKLLMGGANPWETNNNGNNALHWAAHLGRLDVTEWLLGEDNLNVDLPNDDGLTPLMLASKSGKDRLIQMLIEKAGASIDMVEPAFGRTPLELASAKGNSRVVQLLLKNGASWENHKDKMGRGSKCVSTFYFILFIAYLFSLIFFYMKKGNNALELAQNYGYTQVEFLLQRRDPLTGEKIETSEEEEEQQEESTDM
jgi:ankyrin repeat protein